MTTGGTPVTTTYDAANRPTSTGYGSDAEGRLTARPTAGGQTFVWDDLGRLTQVKNAAGTVTLATYSYDPLDRLRLVDRGTSDQVRFRYVGTTTAVAQILDHDAATVSRNIATAPGGERLADWTGGGTDLRIYGTNAHHDVTFTTGSSGTVTATARFDPWGNLATASGTLPDFGFQGSWTDATTALSWVITRWYAPAEGRFISEDSLLGDPEHPASRHLYAYGEGEPVGRWDPDGRCLVYRCVASTNGGVRLAQWKGFFERFPGVYRYCTSYYCEWRKLSGEGRGGGMLDFMRWIIESRRFLSPWWERVNRSEVQSSLTAWDWYMRGLAVIPRGRPADSWSTYIYGGRVAGRPVGGSWKQAWVAHQHSLWEGVAAARGVIPSDKNEKIFIWKVLNNVESYYRLGWDVDGALFASIRLGKYSMRYPATAYAACNAAYLGNYASVVRQYFQPPAHWEDYCAPHIDHLR